MTGVVDLDGVLVSAFVMRVILAVFVLFVIRRLFAALDLWRLCWNPPLAQFGLLVALVGLFTLLS
ncbi:DUF1656 domain-containing protein [Tanticharoenia sakaeratensis]|jgi:hypothetical protein|uniref:DUF1656 domain-containing protein n=1 Tax=Tanticharoenia sakaeratensis NBRC 103193 TaxID=1231623 RepID=A0A0D6MMS9_9PROT|nr:DUF1656 domain-containing protein [Tanticharoenia sakaeratensis]GAN54598.1 hypothetical protein Tasa_025_029 [Tanticharoenia sakaeratensis NBRC 103193]GBQ22961.1 hypothetical protein AA103193_2247 [Tanticharoenia sakaeratensis NBRC 103193]